MTLQPYPITQTWKRGGFYVARFTGTDPKYRVGRDFLTGKPVKPRKTVEYTPTRDLPAWILRRPDTPCHHCGQTRPVRDTGEDVIAAFESGWTNYGLIFGVDDLLAIYARGNPGADGAWRGDRCEDCEITPVFTTGTTCAQCAENTTNTNHLANLPTGEVF